jgi:hypothetical protein
MAKPVATPSAADSVQAPESPLAALLTAVVQTFDLRAWVGALPVTGVAWSPSGRYVTITAEGDDLYYIFSATTNPTITTAAVGLDANAPTAATPNFLAAGQSKDVLVDPAFPYMGARAKTASGSGYCRVVRS